MSDIYDNEESVKHLEIFSFLPVRFDYDYFYKQCQPGCKVLDMGCANGSLAFYLADVAKHVTGIDISKTLISRANIQKEKANKTNTSFVCDNIKTYKPQSSYDLITMSGFLIQEIMTLDDQIELLSKSRSLLSANGKLALTVMNTHPSVFKNPVWTKEVFVEKESKKYTAIHNFNHIDFITSTVKATVTYSTIDHGKKSNELSCSYELVLMTLREVELLLKLSGFDNIVKTEMAENFFFITAS